uniref:Uncharacterized protein n=1 Tax=Solanum lycopersicum TaxID=4081 RepID=A0A3Q7ET87_SOLLC
MEELIFTKIYHGRILSEIYVPTCVENCVCTQVLTLTLVKRVRLLTEVEKIHPLHLGEDPHPHPLHQC